MSIEAMTLLPLGFGLGLIHAFDADHVMAVSALASREKRARPGWTVSLLWSLGHAGCLLAVACIVLPLGLVIPESFTHGVEAAVGFSMIALGLWVASGLIRRRGHIHFHEHTEVPVHAHWHAHESSAKGAAAHRRADHHHTHSPMTHAPWLMGALHGLAGSAPLLALIPAVAHGSLWTALLYLLFFGAGVMIAMLAFGGLLGHGIARLGTRWGRNGLRALHGATATGSVLVGMLFLTHHL